MGPFFMKGGKYEEKYNNFIDNYVSPNGIEPGYKTIINKLKKNYF